MIKFALLGAGRIGAMHADNISACENALLSYVYDPITANAEKVALANNASVASTPEEAVNSDKVDAVFIASASPTHCELIKLACHAGKPVLCEKPLDLDLRKIDDTWQEIKNLNPRVMIGFNRRFDPNHGAVQKRVADGEIGNLEQLIVTSRDPAPPPREYFQGGDTIFKDMMIHDFDLARFILREEPTEIFATSGILFLPWMKELDDGDSAMVVMRTKAGKMCHINNCRRAVYGYDQRVEAFGSQGMLISNNEHNNTVAGYTDKKTVTREPLLHFFIERYKEAYIAELNSFVDAVLNDKPLSPDYYDGRQAIALATAAEQSAKSGNMVKVDTDGGR